MRPRELVGFRVFVIYPFSGDKDWWQIVGWEERDGIQAMAIVDVNNDHIGYLIHYGLSGKQGNEWKESSILWDVAEFSTLRTLFQAVQHGLGILRMPKSDAYKLYGNCDDDDCLPEE
jgi:hypothetical protein